MCRTGKLAILQFIGASVAFLPASVQGVSREDLPETLYFTRRNSPASNYLSIYQPFNQSPYLLCIYISPYVIALLKALQCRMVEDNRYSCSPDFSPAPAPIYIPVCVTRWSLCKAATSLKQPASLVPDSTKALESTSVGQPPLYNVQLELAHRQLS